MRRIKKILINAPCEKVINIDPIFEFLCMKKKALNIFHRRKRKKRLADYVNRERVFRLKPRLTSRRIMSRNEGKKPLWHIEIFCFRKSIKAIYYYKPDYQFTSLCHELWPIAAWSFRMSHKRVPFAFGHRRVMNFIAIRCHCDDSLERKNHKSKVDSLSEPNANSYALQFTQRKIYIRMYLH